MREALGPLRERLVMFDARDALAVALRLAFGRPGPEGASNPRPHQRHRGSRISLVNVTVTQ